MLEKNTFIVLMLFCSNVKVTDSKPLKGIVYIWFADFQKYKFFYLHFCSCSKDQCFPVQLRARASLWEAHWE